jgi:hypothetical protein
MDKLADKRVGADRHRRHRGAVRAAPGAGLQALYVFQRTPSSVDVRDNRPIDPDWFTSIATPGWQQRWLENFTANQAGGIRPRGPGAGRLDRLARRIRAKVISCRPAAHAAGRCWRPSRRPTSRR